MKNKKTFSAWDHENEGWTTLYHSGGWTVIDGVNKDEVSKTTKKAKKSKHSSGTSRKLRNRKTK